MGRFLDATKFYKDCDSIVRVTGDNPMTDVGTMRAMIESHYQKQSDYTFTKSIPQGLRCEIIKRDYLERLHKRIMRTDNTEYMTYYLRMDKVSRLNHYQETEIFEGKYSFTVDKTDDYLFVKKVVSMSDNGIYSDYRELINTVNHIYGRGFSNIDPPKRVDMSEFRINDANE